jgi:hypothetical protein
MRAKYLKELAKEYGVSLPTFKKELKMIQKKLKRFKPGNRLIYPVDQKIISDHLNG